MCKSLAGVTVGSSPGQGLMLHMMVSTACPSHGRPPCWADGLLQVLVLVWLPCPQLLVHSSQKLHSDQWPSTAGRWNHYTTRKIQMASTNPRGSPKVGNRSLSLLNTRRSIPGHNFFWQCRVSESDPWHGLPPLAGSGLLHSRLLFWTPFPHVTLQGLQADHSEKPPCTANKTLHAVPGLQVKTSKSNFTEVTHWV